jgi:WD40 repeat protein
MKAKNISDDTMCHTDDITALRISSDRRSVVSGQVGSSPAAFMWDSVTGEKQQRYKLPKGSRGIDAIALSKDGKYVAMVDRHDNHNVYVFEAQSGQLVGKAKGDTNRAFDMAFSERDGDYSFVTAGAKHIKFW